MRRIRVVVAMAALLFSVALVLHTLFDPNGWTRREKVRGDLETLTAENDQTEVHVGELRRELKSLRTRPEVQQHVVRDELGMVRPDEVVLELASPPETNAP